MTKNKQQSRKPRPEPGNSPPKSKSAKFLSWLQRVKKSIRGLTIRKVVYSILYGVVAAIIALLAGLSQVLGVNVVSFFTSVPTPTASPTATVTLTPTPSITPTLTPTPTATPYMDQAYNIAVAALYVDEQATPRIDTQSFAGGMVALLQKQMANRNSILIWGPEQVGKMASQDPIDIAKHAKDINADLLIYGKLLLDNPCTVILKFYVRPNKLTDAEELSEEEYESGPISVDSCEYDAAYLENLDAASSDLLSMIDVMMNQYQRGKYQETLNALQGIEDRVITYHAERIGHILYLFMGNAAGRSKQYQRAEEYYLKSLKLQPSYARARIGLAGVYYILGIPPLGVDLSKFDLSLIQNAIDLYNQVLQDNVQLNDPRLEAKARFGLGQALFIQSFVKGEAFDRAEQEFKYVITIYNGNDKPPALRVRSAEAHASLGMIYCQQGLNDLALKEYQLVIDTPLNTGGPEGIRKDYFQSKVNNNDCHFDSEEKPGA